jgi:hypothetical protein
MVEDEAVQKAPYCQIACHSVATHMNILCTQFLVHSRKRNADEQDLVTYCNTLSGLISSCLCTSTKAQTAADVMGQVAQLISASQAAKSEELYTTLKGCLVDVGVLLYVRKCHEQIGTMPASEGKLSWEQAFELLKNMTEKGDPDVYSYLALFERGATVGDTLRKEMGKVGVVVKPSALKRGPDGLFQLAFEIEREEIEARKNSKTTEI